MLIMYSAARSLRGIALYNSYHYSYSFAICRLAPEEDFFFLLFFSSSFFFVESARVSICPCVLSYW